ncbi:rubredoxin [Pseudonocardia sediminis]|uniref:Rubredoxin n=1 Tax=Pseudonocardia sediminis TaxID=1397368 RepID=A0A4Q7UUP2_PSEST|nr:rubredoxin [Pseudonocardia sediminis]RZT85476.1 rubredoxin [Pseudonocardia sediminis]
MSAGGTTTTDTAAVQWLCVACGWLYDPDEGDPDSGIEPGTPFEEIPEDWMCPICGATKSDFRALEPGEEV